MSGRIGKAAWRLLLVLGMLLPAATVGATPRAGTAAEEMVNAAAIAREPYFFPETQHYISGRFREYWEERGGLYVFGYPLTKVYMERSTDGKEYPTQYFERARFEYHAENAGNQYDVLLTLVGNEIVEGRRGEGPFQGVDPIPGEGYSEPTRHNIRGIFLQFYQQYGGLQNFGYALSEEFEEVSPTNGQVYRVQYFERERMEYHPENAGTPFEVLLGLLGRERLARLGAPASATAPETSPPTAAEIPGGLIAQRPNWPSNHIEYGFNAFLIGNEGGATFNQQTMAKITEAGFGWIRFQLVWSDFERSPGAYDWLPLDTRVQAANSAGVKIMLSIAKSPKWASPARPDPNYHGLPDDTVAFQRTMGAIAGRYKGRIQSYEIWNEQNLGGEVGNDVQIAPYFNTLKAGYEGVKAQDPFAAVLFGGLTPTGVSDRIVALDDVSYLREFYAYRGGEGKRYYDVLAAHPGSASNPPDSRLGSAPGDCPPAALERYGPQPNGCYNSSADFFFRRIEEQRAVMEQNGEAAKQIWLTEFGWDACQGLPAPRGYEYCQLTSDQLQAEYLVRAFQIGRDEWPWMGVMIMWNLNYAAIPGIGSEDEKYGWGVLRSDFSHRPAYDALKNMPK